MKQLPISLIVTTYNRVDALDLVLYSIKKQSLLPMEVIVGDDGSMDDTKDVILQHQQSFPVPLLHCWQEDKGFRAAQIRNKAIAMSKGDYIVMIDGDMVLHKHFVRDHRGIAKKNQFVQGRRVFLEAEATEEALITKRTKFGSFSRHIRNRFNALRCKILSPLVSTLLSKKNHGSVRTCNLASWKSDIVNINGFNEAFVGWGREDSEFVVRLLNSGVRRKDLRLGGVAYHLYHIERSTEKLSTNHEMFENAIKNRIIRCEIGISQYL